MLRAAPGLKRHDLAAVGYLQRALTLCSIGVAITGMSNHGSMGEHQISHWLDMFAHGGKNKRTIHGEQVGVASVVMARLQARILAAETPPVVRPTTIDEAGLARRYGPTLAPLCAAEMRKTALDAAGAERLNRRLSAIWPELRAELAPMMVPAVEIAAHLASAGGPTTGEALGVPPLVWRDAIRYSREIRGRWSFVNLAADAGLLDDFLEGEH
jgi:glycerol-1-phosphate dehydrogenase [NAD(P)+]